MKHRVLHKQAKQKKISNGPTIHPVDRGKVGHVSRDPEFIIPQSVKKFQVRNILGPLNVFI